MLGFIDVLDPLVVRIHRVDGQGNGLDAAFVELILELGGKAQLGGAHRGEVGGVGEQDAPAVTEPLVETDLAGAGVLLEIGGDVAESDADGVAPDECVMSLLCPDTGLFKKNK